MQATIDDAPATIGEADVYNLYALSLGRQPEAASVVTGMVGADRDLLVRSFFGADEHATNVLAPIEEGLRLAGGLFAQAPGEELCAWIETVLPLTPEGAQAVRDGAASWHAVYAALFADAGFLTFAGPQFATRRQVLVPHLNALAAMEAGIERLTSTGLKGWIVAPVGSGPLTVEARVGDEVVAVGAAREFRREVQDRFGGDGLAGFSLMLEEALLTDPGMPVVEVRERASGLFVGTLQLGARVTPLTTHQRLVQEVAAVRRSLEAIEAALPAVQADLAFELENYGDWRDAYIKSVRHTPAPRSEAVSRVLVALDARGVPLPWISDALESIEAQTLAEWSVLIVGEGRDVADLATSTHWRTGRPVAVVTPEAAEAAVLDAGIEVVVRLAAPGVLEPDALAAILSAMAPETSALFWDEDVLEPAPDASLPSRDRRRRLPWLKTAFDADLLLQEPAIGSGLALSRDGLAAAGEGAWSRRSPSATALVLVEAGQAPLHLARILQSRQREPQADVEAWAATVQDHLDRVRPGARAVATPDPLGAPGAVRVEDATGLGGVSATVIIPSRNRLDLLKPCIDSLLAARASNTVTMDIVIIDHLTDEPDARAYIDGLVAAGSARAIPYDGEYNWSLMNNIGAAASEADVLVFLNNDTAVITPDWLDRTCRQAMRPEVGAVGVRLIFADGAVQHAGFVGRPLADSFLMAEGVGAAGADGGYLGRHARLRRTAAVTGACMAVRSDVYRRFGGFDAANLPYDWNDIDFCLKVRAEGMLVIYEPAAVLYHFESRTRGLTHGGKLVANSMRAAGLVWARWGARLGDDPDYNRHFERPGVPFARLAPR